MSFLSGFLHRFGVSIRFPVFLGLGILIDHHVGGSFKKGSGTTGCGTRTHHRKGSEDSVHFSASDIESARSKKSCFVAADC